VCGSEEDTEEKKEGIDRVTEHESYCINAAVQRTLVKGDVRWSIRNQSELCCDKGISYNRDPATIEGVDCDFQAS